MAIRDTETAEQVGDRGRQPVPDMDFSPMTLAEEAAAQGWTRTTKPEPGMPAPAPVVGTRD